MRTKGFAVPAVAAPERTAFQKRAGSRESALLETLLGTLIFTLSLAGCILNRPLAGEGGLRAIREMEIRKSDAEDLLELIQDLRPSWLLSAPLRDPTDPSETAGPLVVINDLPTTQPLFSLQFVTLEGVREIRYLTATAAETRYRIRSPYGLIVVIRPPPVGPLPPDTGQGLPPPDRRTGWPLSGCVTAS